MKPWSRWIWLAGGLVLIAAGGLVLFLLILLMPSNRTDNQNPARQAEMIALTLEWGRLAPFPTTACNFPIHTEGNAFRTRCGAATSPTFRCCTASCTWQPSWTGSAAMRWPGNSPIRWTATLACWPCSKPWRWDGQISRQDLVRTLSAGDLITPNDKRSILAAISQCLQSSAA